MPAQADAARYAALLYAKLQEAEQHAAPADKERSSKRRRVAAKQQLAGRQDARAAQDEGVNTALLLDRDYDACVQQVLVSFLVEKGQQSNCSMEGSVHNCGIALDICVNVRCPFRNVHDSDSFLYCLRSFWKSRQS
jgi:hypothetical protein